MLLFLQRILHAFVTSSITLKNGSLSPKMLLIAEKTITIAHISTAALVAPDTLSMNESERFCVFNSEIEIYSSLSANINLFANSKIITDNICEINIAVPISGEFRSDAPTKLTVSPTRSKPPREPFWLLRAL